MADSAAFGVKSAGVILSYERKKEKEKEKKSRKQQTSEMHGRTGCMK
jgi:hypothetical protein